MKTDVFFSCLKEYLKNNKSALILFPIFLLFFLWLAQISNWQYDEAWTYDEVKNNTVFDLIRYSKFNIANNHILNSIYFWLLQHCNAQNVVYYRLLSLSAFVIFLYANVEILKDYKINSFCILFLCLATYSCFFFIGRGYSIAIASFSYSYLCLLRYEQTKKIKYEYGLIIWGAVSTIAIFSFLYGSLSIAVIYFFKKRKSLFKVHSFICLLVVCAEVLYVHYAGTIITIHDKDIIGSNTFWGFINELVKLFYTCHVGYRVADIIDTKNLMQDRIAKVVIVVVLIVPPSLAFLYAYRRDTLKQLKGKQILLIIFLSISMMAVTHFFFQAMYPLKRSVIYIQYLLILFLLSTSSSGIKNRIVLYFPVVFFSVLAMGVFSKFAIDSRRSGNEDILNRTNDGILYIWFNGPALLHTKNILKKDNEVMLFNSTTLKQLDSLSKNTNSHRRTYLLFESENLKDSIKIKTPDLYDLLMKKTPVECQSGYRLYRLN